MSTENPPDKKAAHPSDLLPSYKPGNFQSPWHAELFALTLYLHKAGQFSWPEWTQYLGKALKEADIPEFEFVGKTLDNNTHEDAGDDDYYYHAWLGALCVLLCDKQITSQQDIAKMRHRWANAYKTTPHGQPVHLG